MVKKVLMEVSIEGSFDFIEIYNKFPLLRMYLGDFTRVRPNTFISFGTLNSEGKLKIDDFDLRNAILDWSFNCPDESNVFFESHPEGFKFRTHLLNITL